MVAEVIAIISVMGLAAFIQSIIGFGFGLLCLALLTPFIGLRGAAVVGVLPTVALCSFLFHRHRRHVRWKEAKLLAATAIVGVPFGVMFLVHADLGLLQVIMGALLVAGAAQRLIPQMSGNPWPLLVAPPCGLLSGALNGAFGTGGPPLIAFLSTQRYDHLGYMATLQCLFAIGSVIRLEELLRQGVLTAPLAARSAVGVLAAVLGALVGSRFLKSINEEVMTRIVTACLLVLGVYYVVLGARSLGVQN
jgi:uncharacterized membrane protein YfcA